MKIIGNQYLVDFGMAKAKLHENGVVYSNGTLPTGELNNVEGILKPAS